MAAPPIPVNSLDPHGDTSLDPGTRTAASALFDSLVKASADGVEPSLAESWEVSDGTEWTFTLRPDVTFHDGTALTAEDVRASLQRVLDAEGPLAGQFASVTDMAAADDRTFSLVTSAPDGDLLASLSLLRIAPADRLGSDDFWQAPIGSGPFEISSFQPGESVTLRAYNDYWGGSPAVETLELVWIPDAFGRATALETGEIDVTWGLANDQLSRLEESADLTIGAEPSFASWVIWMNAQNEPFDDARVRRALWQAVDWQQIVDDLMPRTGQLATSAVSPSVFGWTEMPSYEYDPDAARSLLDEAGYADGVTFNVQFREAQRLLTQAVASYWSEVGVQVQLNEKTQAVWLEDLLALNWDVNVMTQSAATGDSGILLERLYPCDAERTGYCNEDLDALIAEASSTVEPEEREQAYVGIIEHLWTEAVGIYPIDVLESYVWANSLEGFVPAPDGIPSFAEVSKS